MQKERLVPVLIACMAMSFGSTGRADVPAPPVNQNIGMDDVAFGELSEGNCRICHASGVPDRHHLLYGQTVPDPSLVPNPSGTVYACTSCHGDNFMVVRDCTACHDAGSPHHTTSEAVARNCVACHGDLVDNFDDGHSIPTYSPSLVTPLRSGGDGLPANSRGVGAGGCDYCHDDDGLTPPVILTSENLHHTPGLTNCSWCHVFTLPFEENIRVCEQCHGPDSLHNIQVDSPNASNIGTLVVGGEDAGYGHVGRDAGPGDSDCWGCHGYELPPRDIAPGSGPTIPTVHNANRTAIDAGTGTTVTLTGSSFMNTTDGTEYVSNVALVAGDGSSVALAPDQISQGSLTVTIPGDTPAGNYNLQAVKREFASNPAVITIIPAVNISGVAGDTIVTIHGSGFGGYAAGSGTSVTGLSKITRPDGGKLPIDRPRPDGSSIFTVEATIVSWSDTTIEARFDSQPFEITVNSVFGSDTVANVSQGSSVKSRGDDVRIRSTR